MSFVSPLPPRRFAETVLSAALFAALTSPVIAQTANPGVTELQSIKVQASEDANGIDGFQAHKAQSVKFSESLLNTPRSITVIPEEVIRDRGATSLQDVLRTTPGITLGSGEGGTPMGDRPFIRGYEASTDIFIDGVRDYSRGSHETFNLESVEVLKGPSSAYTGRGGTGGSLNLVTKSPKLKDFFQVEAGYGTSDQYRLTADGNYAFSETGAIRLNLMRMGGEVAGRDGVKIDRWGIAPSIAFGLGTPTRVTLSYSRLENKDMPDLGFPFKNAANPDRVTPLEADRDNFYGRRNVDFRKYIADTASASIEHDLNDRFTVRNVTRYSKTLNHYLMTRPSFDNCAAGAGGACATEGAGLQFRRDDRTNYRVAESLLNQTDVYGSFNTGWIKHDIVAGVEISKEEIHNKTMTGGPGRDTDSFYDPNPNRQYNYSLQYGPKTKTGDIKTRSAYIFDTLTLSEQWMVNGGLRFDRFEADNTKDSRKDDMWNYQLGVVYKPARNGSIYLSYGTSSNPTGENLGQAGGADGPAGGAAIRDLKPERSYSWELGTKWDVADEKLSLTAAIFQTDKKDARSTDPLTGDVSLSGSNRVRGLELGAAGAITPNWNLWAGYTYLDPKIKKYRSGNNVFDGNQMKFISKQSFNVWTTYKVMPELTLGAGATFVGKRFVDDANQLKLPSYWRYDAMARYDLNKNVSFQFNVNNISNVRMYDASHVGIFANVGPGRSYMFNASYRFE
ncbi:TonB-dependent receptor [Alcaligenes faecalis]|nr:MULTISPECIES: TonB-dependent siderophore receptor [Alcaligenes]ALO40322.1 TonB-dependent receptor [Alcaligenes faecalis]MBW4788746.1 TonB-dependent siderophore receptor [Alcaligenes faecalis subsp. faecalis]MDT0216852.1 TonB-dependent siderophore receptor [Alcaligenes sp. AB3]OSZ32371.1 TonB-dependent siderophore receptor [Alcaligenes faecalis]OSZ40778.1 TonB-dependent siderophore receptor [Alcaligenes faecalis]